MVSYYDYASQVNNSLVVASERKRLFHAGERSEIGQTKLPFGGLQNGYRKIWLFILCDPI